MKKLLPVFILAVLIIGGGAFFAGMKYDQSKNSLASLQNLTPEQRQQRMQQAGAAGGFRGTGAGGGARTGSGFVSGDIISKSDNSVTVKLQDGGSKIVFFSDSTSITKSTDGAFGDLETGKTIIVNGITNSDGSVTATNIQIRPEIGIPQNINQ
ncbi:MAG: DUF5666 domain-containing protein [bacterium]|nr:DUF5666 domain-containing protein [bacterium]